MSLPKYLETVMVHHAQVKGVLPDDYELLGETRGGNRSRTNTDSGA